MPTLNDDIELENKVPHQQNGAIHSQQGFLLSLLKQHFGFDSFRPLQADIISDVLAGHDVFALLPTGGGKSLCFQLPALVEPGLTVVVSPLIALMKDQVDGLKVNGVAATFINSSLDAAETRQRWQGLHKGQFRLLYVAPERLMQGDFLSILKTWNVKLIAIDEAHCISEWGHDFRPEYRKLAQLRSSFPEVPLLAVTATATERVRTDIIRLLQLKNPRNYVASFNRPNLTYHVVAKHQPYNQVLAYLRTHSDDSGIIYCLSRQTTEDLAQQLSQDGIKAKPYHAGLDAKTRSEHQDLFLRDDVQVICATIAFGMGINKSNVRFVLHYDLPKNLEGYYQETGRAGRDGLPSDCVLLFSPNDARKQNRFIEEKADPQEQQIARRQLQDMVRYAESAQCRRHFLLNYFGETAKPLCDRCDNCLTPRPQFDGTLASQKFLSCVYRIKEKSGFGVGLSHIADVLRGSENEKIERWAHHELSTYGIGKEFSRREWLFFGQELIRMGLLAQSPGMLATLNITEKGMQTLRDRTPIELTQPLQFINKKKDKKNEKMRAPTTTDQALFDHLRRLRKQLADEQQVPAYIIFSDASLRHMAHQAPTTLSAFSKINGVGQKKLKAFGELFIQEIARFRK